MTELAGLRILLIEDEPIVAVLTEELIDAIGCVVAATVATLADAHDAIANSGFDIVMLDVNLDGDDGLSLLPTLQQRNIAYIVTTGYGAAATARIDPGAVTLTKPYSIAELETALRRVANRH